MKSRDVGMQSVVAAVVCGVASLGCSGGPSEELDVIGRTELAMHQDPVAFCLDENIDRTPIIGTSNNDVLTGTPGDDCIVGLGGQDTINAGGGNDIIFGG